MLLVLISFHAQIQAYERGANLLEVIETVETGQRSKAKDGKFRFKKTFAFNNNRNGKYYVTKQIEAIAGWDGRYWIEATVMVKYY